jgi:hypothetical protein
MALSFEQTYFSYTTKLLHFKLRSFQILRALL